MKQVAKRRVLQSNDELSTLRNIGKAMRADFELLGIQSIKQLAKCDADELYARIQALTRTRHDPCVWDTYAAAIHQAKTGEALPWWDFTKVRKQRNTLTLPAATQDVRMPRAHGGAGAAPLGRGVKKKSSTRSTTVNSALDIPIPSPGSGRGNSAANTSTTLNPTIKAKFNSYPTAIKTRLLSLRELILEVAATTDDVGPLEETLKWGQISYVTSKTGSGSLIRIDQHRDVTTEYALYFHCQTTLVDTFRELFRHQFKFEGNRCLVLDVRKAMPVKALRQCIALALTYHLSKK